MSVLVTNTQTPYGRALAERLRRDGDVITTELATLRHSRPLHDLLFDHRELHAVVHDSTDPELTRQLLLACERHPSIRRFVFRSSGEVYTRWTQEPNLLDEDAPLDFERASADLVVCSHQSRLSIAVMRCAEVLAPGGQLWDYLQSRVCLRPLGFDPMLNVLSVEDHVRAHVLAVHGTASGIFNIPGFDTLPLSRMIALAGRRDLPLPGPLLAPLYQLRTRLVGFEFRYDLNMRRFHFGGILDGTRARRELGYEPARALDLSAPADEGRTSSYPRRAGRRARDGRAAPHTSASSSSRSRG